MEIVHTKGKFSARTLNGESELLYINRDNTYIRIYRAFTPDKDQDSGIAERLTIAAFDFARENGLKVRPDCPFVVTFLETHKKFGRLLAK